MVRPRTMPDVLFVGLRVISWIEFLHAAGDPLNHTKNHELQKLFSFIHGTGEHACLL
jgi:hypothetical protein